MSERTYLGPTFDRIIGHKVEAIWISEDGLAIDTDAGRSGYSVYGDCCSQSIFHDFVGVAKLLECDRVIEVSEVELADVTDDQRAGVKANGSWWDDAVQAYGYRFVAEHPQWGEVTAVLSFRNYSNGYYGGEMENDNSNLSGLARITADWDADSNLVLGDPS
jgi:hypothetical protein